MKICDVQTRVLRHELAPAEVFGSAKGWHGASRWPARAT